MVILLFVLVAVLLLTCPTPSPSQAYPTDDQLNHWSLSWQPILYGELKNVQSQRNSSSPIHIVFSGDSTMRQQRDFLCWVLDGDHHLPPGKRIWDVMHPAQMLHLTTPQSCWNEKLQVRVTFHLNSCCVPLQLPHFNPTDPGWGPNTTTTVLYLNCGLHLLHLGGARPFECLSSYVYLEERLAAVAAGAPEVIGSIDLHIYMTTVCICASAFTTQYADVEKLWNTNRSKVISECTARYSRSKTTKLTPVQIQDACTNAFFDSGGAQSTNKRALALMQQLAQNGTIGRYAVLDAFEMTRDSCWATHLSDGRHFMPYVPLQLSQMIGHISRNLPG